jgi:RNA polymerase I-specific transcription initiation factor RRN3
MYIVCFYGKEMFLTQMNDETLRSQWQIIVCCDLHPLQFCLQSVRYEFLRLASNAGMFQESFWNQLPKSYFNHDDVTDTATKQSRTNPLDSFFPFDPCLLSNLHHHIMKHYRLWDDSIDIHGDEDEDDEETDENGSQDQASDDETSEMIHIASSMTSVASMTSGVMSVASTVGSMPGSLSEENLMKLASKIRPRSFSTSSHQSGVSVSSQSPFCSPNIKHEWTEEDYEELERSRGNVQTSPLQQIHQYDNVMPVRRARQNSIGSTGSW